MFVHSDTKEALILQFFVHYPVLTFVFAELRSVSDNICFKI